MVIGTSISHDSSQSWTFRSRKVLNHPDLKGIAYVVLVSELFAERCAHDSSADAGGGGEVRFSRLPPRGIDS